MNVVYFYKSFAFFILYMVGRERPFSLEISATGTPCFNMSTLFYKLIAFADLSNQ